VCSEAQEPKGELLRKQWGTLECREGQKNKTALGAEPGAPGNRASQTCHARQKYQNTFRLTPFYVTPVPVLRPVLRPFYALHERWPPDRGGSCRGESWKCRATSQCHDAVRTSFRSNHSGAARVSAGKTLCRLWES